MQYGAATQNSYAQGGTQSAANSGGKCSCFGGCFKKLSDRGAGMSAGSVQYATSSKDQYSQGNMQTSGKCGGKCSCFGGSSKMLGASAVDSRQTQAYGQSQEGSIVYSEAGGVSTGKAAGTCSCCFGGASKMRSRTDQQTPLVYAGSAQNEGVVPAGSKSRGKCPCFGGSAKMVGTASNTQAAAISQPVQVNVATYKASQVYETQQVDSGAYVIREPEMPAPTTQIVREAPQPQGDVLIATQELYAPLEVTSISLGDESQPIVQTEPTAAAYATAAPSAVVSMPQTLATGQPSPVAPVATAMYSARTTANYAVQAPARSLYTTRQATNQTVISQGVVSPVPTATVQTSYTQSTASPVTYTSTAPSQLSAMSMQGFTYPSGNVVSMPYRESTGQAGLQLTGSVRTGPGQIMRESAVYLAPSGCSAVVTAGGTPAGSQYVAASTSPLAAKSPSSFMSQPAVSSQSSSMMSQQPMTNPVYLNQPMSLTHTMPAAVMTQAYDGFSASNMSRALRTVQGPMANTRAFQKEISRSTESMQ